jgi:ergothioneine biosynthesis protein EgtB
MAQLPREKQLSRDKPLDGKKLLANFLYVRAKTMELFSPLKTEDAVIQSDPSFGSPPNWHIAHVTWFFHKILEKHGVAVTSEDDDSGINLEYLNSYYQKYGNILPKSERGKFPRPTVDETIRYRRFIENRVVEFIQHTLDGANTIPEDLAYDIILGNQHEMQHQELMIYDFQHYFQRFPGDLDNYKPQRVQAKPMPETSADETWQMIAEVPGGLYQLGFSGGGFCYDNELPEHKVFLQPFKIDIFPVTNREFIRFIEAGGYDSYKYWYSDGWDAVQTEGWKCPLYWESRIENGKQAWMKKDFGGYRTIDLDEPVVNVSYYEADAFARWAGKRLPTEPEWEKAASWNEERQQKTIYPWGNEEPTQERANLLESGCWGPCKVGSFPKGRSHYGCHQMIGDVWEWTSSEYVLYPGFKSLFPEYTDKWAVNQKVLRGGCFATPTEQIRNSYRNYFKPHERILFAGFRCASD